jgi:hypothetical protein
MELQATYHEGHLIVAAIRVLKHRHGGRPPTVEEVAEQLALSREWIGVVAAALARAGVLDELTGPFETRIDIRDHLALEDLPRADATAGVDEELREFSAKKREEEEGLRKLFASGDALKKQQSKMGKLADDLKRYKPKGPTATPLFKDAPPEDD